MLVKDSGFASVWKILCCVACFLLLLLSGCAPKQAKLEQTVFFPPAPDPPRIQFLLGIGDSRDVVGDETEFSLVSMAPVENDEVKIFIKPYGITSNGHRIYVSDSLQSKVAVIDLQQKSFEWLKGNFGPGVLKKPINLTLDREGNLYVVDVVLNLIKSYDQEGNFLRSYGADIPMEPVDIAVHREELFVLDKSSGKVLVLSIKTGKFISSFGQESDDPKERLALPTNMSIDKRGILYVSNIISGRVLKMDRDGHVLDSFGRMGDGFGQFARPKGLASDDEGRFYVVDSAYQNVQMFNPEGRLLMFFGGPGQPAGSLSLPAGIEVTAENLEFFQTLAEPGFKLEQVIMVVSQVSRYNINIYGLGKREGLDYEQYYQETQEQRRRTDEKNQKMKETKGTVQ